MNEQLNTYIDKIKQTINLNEIEKIRTVIKNTQWLDQDLLKYCNIDKQIYDKTRWAIVYFKLLEKRKLDILDISCGSGWFPYICKYFGHNVFLTDQPSRSIITKKPCETNNLYIYDMFLVMLNLKRNFQFKINSGISIKLCQKFDAVTSLGITYCYKWNSNDWKFFIDDIIENLLKDKVETYIFLIPNLCVGLDNFIKNQDIFYKNKSVKKIEVESKRIINITVFKD